MKPNPIFPSILSTNFFNLESRLQVFQSHHLDFIHLDVMDGHFVDNLSFGPSAVKAIKSSFAFGIDSHLMVSNPGKMIPKFIQAGSEWVSFHVEAVKNSSEIEENIKLITSRQRKAGLVLNPDTDVKQVFPYLNRIDYVLLMSVFPGYGGQSFIPATVARVRQLKNQILSEGCDCLVQVDGGINTTNIESLISAGADLFVIGTFLFNSENIPITLTKIQNKIRGVQ